MKSCSVFKHLNKTKISISSDWSKWRLKSCSFFNFDFNLENNANSRLTEHWSVLIFVRIFSTLSQFTYIHINRQQQKNKHSNKSDVGLTVFISHTMLFSTLNLYKIFPISKFAILYKFEKIAEYLKKKKGKIMEENNKCLGVQPINIDTNTIISLSWSVYNIYLLNEPQLLNEHVNLVVCWCISMKYYYFFITS